MKIGDRVIYVGNGKSQGGFDNGFIYGKSYVFLKYMYHKEVYKVKDSPFGYGMVAKHTLIVSFKKYTESLLT